MTAPPGFAAPHRTLGRYLYDFWAHPLPAEPLALFRILTGALVLLSLLTSLGPRLPRDLGPDGLYPAPDGWIKRSGRFCLLRGPVNLPVLEDYLPREYADAWRDWCDEPEHAARLSAALAMALACMTLGLCTRPATVVAWALFVSFNQRLDYVTNGGDSMMRCALFYLMFARSGTAWSVDRLLWGRRGGEASAPAWPVRLMQIQLALVYFFTGLSKTGGDWLDGQAVYWVLNDLSITRWPYAWLPVPMFVCRLLSWGTLLFEIGFPFFVAVGRRRRFALEAWGGRPEEGFRFALTVPALRPWALLAGVAFHLGILVHTEVGWFSPATAAWYALFLSGEGLRKAALTPWTILLRRRPRPLTPIPASPPAPPPRSAAP